MKKLNNKGMTTIELLVSFVLIAIISSTLYVTVSNYNNKRVLESQKLQINTYKNILTKDIQDDLIKNGVVALKKLEKKDGNYDVYIADLTLRDLSKRRIVVKRQLADDYLLNEVPEGGYKNYDDDFHIYYGTPNTDINNANYISNLEDYPIPDFGFSYNHTNISGQTQRKVKDFRVLNIRMSDENNTFGLFIGFYHPDLGSRFAINIVTPINYET